MSSTHFIRSKFKSVYVELEGGFWGLIDSEGNQYTVINMPEQLKVEGKELYATLKPIDGMSMSMWGSLAEVFGFSTS